ncbi:DUF4365 domain-containing protein [Fuerstiella marisgermanici]|nr:DUF4365 domain-containing protein [Fuerstiella marisgermanici]
MGKRKQRAEQHVMEDESIQIVSAALPRSWVVRQYRPDYGLDLAVETFEDFAGSGQVETLGEHFFVQVKSVGKFSTTTLTAQPRHNVTKPQPTSYTSDDETQNIEVVKHQIDTSLLRTVQAMGASTVVMLFLVSLDSRRVLFLCLNDYIDKIVVPEKPLYYEQATITLNVPMKNELSRSEVHGAGTAIIRFIAKRSKFYSAFNLFAYQRHELSFCSDGEEQRNTAKHFLGSLRRLDVWGGHDWKISEDYFRWLLHLDSVLPGVPLDGWFASHPFTQWSLNHSHSREEMFNLDMSNFWNGLNVLSRNYEEVCREWNLPTHLAACLAQW